MSTVSCLEAAYRPMVPGSRQGQSTSCLSNRYPKSSAESSWNWPARRCPTSSYPRQSGSRAGSCTARPRSRGPIVCSITSDGTCIVSPSPTAGSSRSTTVGLSSGTGGSAKRPAGRCRWRRRSLSAGSCSTFCLGVSTKFATTACGRRRTDLCYIASAISLRSIKLAWPCATRLNRNHTNQLEAHGPVKVNPVRAAVRVCWSGLLPFRVHPERHRHCATADLTIAYGLSHASPWRRFLATGRLRLRSNSAAFETSDASDSRTPPRASSCRDTVSTPCSASRRRRSSSIDKPSPT